MATVSNLERLLSRLRALPELSEAQEEEFSRLLVGCADLLAPRSQTQEEP